MKFISLELTNYKRLALNNISYLKITFTEILQLILGSNGSGKSSVLYQLTPLPAIQQDFEKTGKKLIVIEHYNSVYKLQSSFSPSQKHSFIKDDIELNDGGTITVQKDLVKEHFGITSDIHELIIGKENFTSMSFAKRKEWFIKLCDTDYEYAISVYNRIREKHRDVSGAIKLAKKRLVIESEKLIKTDEETKLNSEIKDLHTTLNLFLELRKPIEDDLDLLHLEQNELDSYLLKCSKTLETLIDHLKTESLTIEQIEEQIKFVDLESYSITSSITKLSEKHSSNSKKIEILQRAKQATIETLTFELSNLYNDLTSIKNSILVGLIDNPDFCYNTFSSIKSNLSDIFNSIPVNKDRKYSQEKLIKARQDLAEVNLQKENVSKDIQNKNIKLKHMEEHKDKPDLSCPNCNHKFSLNYNELDYNKLNTNINQLEKLIENDLNVKIKNLTTYINECLEYSIHYRQYIQLTKSWPQLNMYWDYLNSLNIITDVPNEGIHHLNIVDNDLIKQIEYSKIAKVIEDKDKLLSSIKEVDGIDLDSLIKENDAISNELELLSNKQSTYQNNKKSFIHRKNIIINSNDLISKIRKCISDKKSLNVKEIETLRRTHLNNTIRELQSHLANRENILYNVQLQKTVSEDINKQIIELEKQEKSLNLLVNNLSPSDGLIAEGLLGFINSFIDQMNNFIRKIWTYPLKIQSCSIEDNQNVDLDYKFPIAVGSVDNVISDVSRGSTGMMEVVNLAFRVTAMQYLGLKGYPLSLDEAGASFDEAHRSQFTQAIKSLLDQHVCNQLFIISHYSESFGALSNPEVCVLDSSNITLPYKINKVNSHVVIN